VKEANNCTCKGKTDDYQDEMKSENYTRWLKEKLIRKLPPGSVIVSGDASYHNAQDSTVPASVSNKKLMQDWLTDRNSPFSTSMFKTETYELTKLKKKKLHFKCYKLHNLLQNKVLSFSVFLPSI
jgi:hypothetical protein